MICPECHEEMDAETTCDISRMIVFVDWQCPNCGAEVVHIDDVDDNQLEYDSLGFVRYVKPKTDPNEM